jgi:transposase
LLINQHLPGYSRWHILKNVREALERFLVRFRKPIAEIGKAFEATQLPRNKRTKSEQALRNEAHARRVARFEKVRAALEQGKTIAEITRELHVSKWFVRCCAKTNEVPAVRQNARMHSILDPFVDQLEDLWRSGIRNGKQFWRELRDAGFKGSYKRVHQWVQAKQVQSRLIEPVPESNQEITEKPDAVVPTKKTARTRSFAPLALAWLLTMEDESLDEEDKHILEQLGIKCPDALKARALVLEFSRLLKAKEADRLSAWFDSVKASGISDLSRFAVSLERERAALENAVRLPWSNGPVEGTVNRIRLLKRQGYGRASFSLLRKRILGAG